MQQDKSIWELMLSIAWYLIYKIIPVLAARA
ncbi:hypothetical protein Halhy_5530 [Haliscomenobacter hydrossis DSM 1100]|uniref:Uncharacterized protein n=1 Tax=Haliscomenobacter hydrossis (strain ATCC 27775 / DSM 1100 / LMG 10767 / O) TaxID=760192 RepID=F4KSF2_HALH1|nr:hypothetical protein Halhy_5530 [Haliscomenobacter hydrossis DSM 1100]